MTRLLLASFLFLPGCFLAFNLPHGGKGPSEDVDTDFDTDLSADTDLPSVGSFQLTLDPNTVTPGEQALLVAKLTGDATADDVASIALGPEVLITTTRVLDADEIAISVDVADAATVGPVDVMLDIDGVGVVVFPRALEIVAP